MIVGVDAALIFTVGGVSTGMDDAVENAYRTKALTRACKSDMFTDPVFEGALRLTMGIETVRFSEAAGNAAVERQSADTAKAMVNIVGEENKSKDQWKRKVQNLYIDPIPYNQTGCQPLPASADRFGHHDELVYPATSPMQDLAHTRYCLVRHPGRRKALAIATFPSAATSRSKLCHKGLAWQPSQHCHSQVPTH